MERLNESGALRKLLKPLQVQIFHSNIKIINNIAITVMMIVLIMLIIRTLFLFLLFAPSVVVMRCSLALSAGFVFFLLLQVLYSDQNYL